MELGLYLVVHPVGNSDMVEACERYGELLADRTTVSSATFEELLDAGALPKGAASALRERYLPG